MSIIRANPHRRFGRRGVTAIEYGILCFLIIVAIIGVLTVTGTDLEAVFNRVGTGMANATKTVQQVLFDGFGTFSSPVVFCPTYGYSGFSGSGGVISLDVCGAYSESTTYNDLTSNTDVSIAGSDVLFTNPLSNKPITVPALQGAGTGFSIPSNGFAALFKRQIGTGSNFKIYSPSASFTTANLASAKAACAKMGGSLSGNASDQVCYNGTPYTGSEIATVLPPQS